MPSPPPTWTLAPVAAVALAVPIRTSPAPGRLTATNLPETLKLFAPARIARAIALVIGPSGVLAAASSGSVSPRVSPGSSATPAAP